MLPVNVHNKRVHVGLRFSASIQRCDRMSPELARRPVSHGQLPVRIAGNSLHTPNTDVSRVSRVIVPCDEDEAVWLGFSDENSSPIALKIRQGEVNAVTADDWEEYLHDPQDYVVPPIQTSWYGIASAAGHLRQFSREPIELVIYEPKQSVDSRTRSVSWNKEFHAIEENPPKRGATDFMVVPDPFGITVWSSEPSGRVSIHFVDSKSWRSLTGEAPPNPTPGYRGTLLP